MPSLFFPKEDNFKSNIWYSLIPVNIMNGIIIIKGNHLLHISSTRALEPIPYANKIAESQ